PPPKRSSCRELIRSTGSLCPAHSRRFASRDLNGRIPQPVGLPRRRIGEIRTQIFPLCTALPQSLPTRPNWREGLRILEPLRPFGAPPSQPFPSVKPTSPGYQGFSETATPREGTIDKRIYEAIRYADQRTANSP